MMITSSKTQVFHLLEWGGSLLPSFHPAHDVTWGMGVNGNARGEWTLYSPYSPQGIQLFFYDSRISICVLQLKKILLCVYVCRILKWREIVLVLLNLTVGGFHGRYGFFSVPRIRLSG
jgi:hypothetical protein